MTDDFTVSPLFKKVAFSLEPQPTMRLRWNRRNHGLQQVWETFNIGEDNTVVSVTREWRDVPWEHEGEDGVPTAS